MSKGITLPYTVGDTVLMKTRIIGIRLDADGKTIYLVEINHDDWAYMHEMHIAIPESQIVCGWIGDTDETLYGGNK